ncbi:choice-of-anchor M domain-containing protein [Actinosynnema sp. NPDC050801]|uniref:choice-of-anchor M domain-containing protein n=1 Tax=unclassified Actinosynnema TaxID=2637065 RepID=UPI0033DE35B3
MRTTARIALLMAAVTGLSGLVAAPATAAPVVTIDTGHVDVFGVAYEDGAFDLHVHDETNDVEYAPAEVLLVAKSAAKTTVPADPAYAFLGAPGAPVWVLPEIDDPALLWPGIATEEVEPGVFVDGSLRLKVTRVYGPGDFSIFTTDAVGAPNVLVDSGNGLPDRIDLAAGSHLHANWAFEAAGYYRVTVRAVGTLASTGAHVVSDPATYTFKVNR